MKGNAQLIINNGAFINNGSFTPGEGRVIFSGPSDTTISYISGSAPTTYYNLSIQKPGSAIAAKSKITVTDSVSVSDGFLYSNNYLVLNSDSSGTAIVTELPVDGNGVATAGILGKVSVERYIPARKSWRLLSAPVMSSGSPTINAAWQESVTTGSANANPNPGYGTHITGGTTAAGYDQGPTPNTSIKVYNATLNGWTALTSAGTANTSITNYPGYFLYVRGDRSVNLAQGVNLTPVNTKLRMSGDLKSGNQVFPVNANNFTVVGNPYASPIDFHTILKTNVSDKVYIWDPKMSGQYGLGAYVTLNWNDNTSSYDATSSVSPVSQYIPSGEAFIVTASDTSIAGSVTIRESDKKNGGSDEMFGFTAGTDPRTRIDLYKVNADNTSQLLDGALVTFADNNLNIVNEKDAIKPFGAGELIGIMQQGKSLSIERRRTIQATDTIYLQQSQMRLGNYKLVIELSNLVQPGLTAFLKDNFAPENRISLDLNAPNEFLYTIINNPGSYASNRFSILFQNLTVVPVRFKTINAFKQTSSIAIEWTTDNEVNVASYIIEKSINGTDFTGIQDVRATAALNYSGLDQDPVNGNNYYRIKSVNKDGSFQYSPVVMVVWGTPQTESVLVYPNPVTGKKINIYFKENKSRWSYRIFSHSGEKISQGSIKSGSMKSVLELPSTTSAGNYELELISDSNERKIIRLLIN